ncbi:MAG TPA: CU044_5270 family protein [Pseudonocardiaceae bacterium]
MADQVHPIWTDDELDAALAGLHNDRDPANLTGARTALYSALGEPEPIMPRSRRRWPQWAAAAAVVALLVAGALVVRNGTGPVPKASTAVPGLQKAVTGAQDPVLKPGQYHYIRVEAWWSTTVVGGPRTTKTFEYLADNVIETWVPADQTQTWMQRRSIVGQRKWVIGTEAEAEAVGIVSGNNGAPTQLTAPCGDLFPNQSGLDQSLPQTLQGGTPSCADVHAGWQHPTPAWFAGLPTDPQAMLARLRHDVPGVTGTPDDVQFFGDVADALRSGLVSAKVTSVLYRTLLLLPEVRVTQHVANLDGRIGVAMGIDSTAKPGLPSGTYHSERQEIIIDPVANQFIGERAVAPAPVGTVSDLSSITTSVVHSIGSTR